MKAHTVLTISGIRVLLVLLGIMLFLSGLTGCVSAPQSENKSENKDDSLGLFLSELNGAETLEYNGVQITQKAKSQEKQYVHVEYTKNPFSISQRIGTLSDSSFVILEHYLRDRGEIADYSVKTGIIDPFDEDQLSFNKNGDFTADGALKDSTENNTTLKGEEKQLMIQYFDQPALYDIGYLIEKNIGTFNKKDEKIADTAYVRYDGLISADSVLDRYSDFGRERIKAKMKMIDMESELKSNASREEMKDELMKLHAGVDIAEGIYELVFADEAAPISIWIPVDAGKPCKIKIDYSNAYKNKNIKLLGLSPDGEYEKTVNYDVLVKRLTPAGIGDTIMTKLKLNKTV